MDCSHVADLLQRYVHIFGLFQILMRIHSYGGRLISIVRSRFKEVLRAFLWILIVGTIVDSNKVLRGMAVND